jgi:hypothetical protein
MVIGDFVGYSSLGLGGNFSRINPNNERNQVTLDAKLDPKKPNEYAVHVPLPAIAAPEKSSDIKSAGKRFPQNDDPVSRAFQAVEDYQSRPSKIDIYV